MGCSVQQAWKKFLKKVLKFSVTKSREFIKSTYLQLFYILKATCQTVFLSRKATTKCIKTARQHVFKMFLSWVNLPTYASTASYHCDSVSYLIDNLLFNGLKRLLSFWVANLSQDCIDIKNTSIVRMCHFVREKMHLTLTCIFLEA